jgi:hypothetical protein
MTQIILKTAVWKEDTEEIADKRTSGGIAVSESAIGPAFVRMKYKLTIKKNRTLPLILRNGVSNSNLYVILKSIIIS